MYGSRCTARGAALLGRSTCDGFSDWIVGRIAPGVVGELNARVAMRWSWRGVPTVCPTSSLVARFVGIVSSFCERAVRVGDADGRARIGQAHQDGCHRRLRHIVLVQRVRD